LLGLLGQASLAGANAFEAVVEVPNWRRPEGLKAYRTFIAAASPGAFYRRLSPITIVLLAAGLALGFQGGTRRDLLVGVALAANVLAELATVLYFFPRNRVLFEAPEPGDPRAATLVEQWRVANLGRIAVVALGFVAGALGASPAIAALAP
jgi:hypothetical protein